MRTLGGEVEGRRRAAGRVAPVDGALPVAVLVVVQHAVLVLARVPVLRAPPPSITASTQRVNARRAGHLRCNRVVRHRAVVGRSAGQDFPSSPGIDSSLKLVDLPTCGCAQPSERTQNSGQPCDNQADCMP